MYGDHEEDKGWARRYLLDPLTEPEPNQETGPGASHYIQLRDSVPRQPANLHSYSPRPHSRSSSHPAPSSQQHSRSNTGPPQSHSARSASHHYFDTPSPASTGAPTPSSTSSSASPAPSPRRDTSPPRLFLPDDVVTPTGSFLDEQPTESLPPPPPYTSKPTPYPASRRKPVPMAEPFPTTPREDPFLSPSERFSGDHRRASLDQQGRSSQAGNRPRNRSLNERFPGDMSHRPLDVLRREARLADKPKHRCDHPRHAHHSHRKTVSASGHPGPSSPSAGLSRSASSRAPRRAPHTDLIDNLDTIGGSYHHGGPYDATLASRNLNDKYSPVAAVRDSNMEAIRATPSEFMDDSLRHHVPLQGVAMIPSGAIGPGGRIVEYEEGADLMREPDAPGGAYKRWDGIQYHPDDLKGKGEPSYTYERDLRKSTGKDAPTEYEMQPRSTRRSRRRSHNDEAYDYSALATSANLSPGAGKGDSVRRSNTTGKKLTQGLRKRLAGLHVGRGTP